MWGLGAIVTAVGRMIWVVMVWMMARTF